MLTATNIHKKYGQLEVLKGVNLSVNKGEIISIVGASGAGKSTLLQILGTLDKQDSGSVVIDNLVIEKLNNRELATLRNQKIGFIFQFHNLLPEFTLLENIAMPALIGGKSIAEVESDIKHITNILHIEHRLDHKPSEISGGEQQRAAVARALINKPQIIFADEPSGNLDSKNAIELHKLFFDLRDRFEQTFVIVTHNHELANMADRKLTMQDGIIM
jgi:lipoprotein-releasing system ATP-binding protein